MSTRPSFFEVYAAQHLSAALRPAVRFVFDVFSVRNPRLIPLATHSDEIFTALLLVLETSQLRRDSALLAESFYSLRRTVFASFHAQAAEQPLATRHVVLSLVFSVLIPHIAVKCQQWYSDQTGGAAAAFFPDGIPQVPAESLAVHPSLQLSTANVTPNPQTQSRLNRLLIRLFQSPKRLMNLFNALRHYTTTPAFRSLAMKWYPRVCAFFETINMLFNVAYMYGHTRYFSLSLALQGLVLRRSGPIDLLHLTTSKMYSATQYSSPLYRFLSAASERLLMLLKSGFIASIFAFRFLQYYYAAEASAPRETGPVVPPPEPLEPAPGVDKESAMAPGRCPLCNKTRTNPTACSPSGYVFCYLCIVGHLQRAQKCPVTLAPATVNDLVRVYDDAGTA